jgi:hypothetical protein
MLKPTTLPGMFNTSQRARVAQEVKDTIAKITTETAAGCLRSFTDQAVRTEIGESSPPALA